MDSDGNFKPIDFEIESRTEVRLSCSATINGEFYIFGGSTQRRQVSKIIDCSLNRVGDLPYELYYPACGTFKFPEERSMICFPFNHAKSCVSFDGLVSYTHPNSTFTHYATTLSSIDNQVVAVGSVRRYSEDGLFSESNNKGCKICNIDYVM